MIINERVRLIRKAEKLNQKDFGQKLRLKNGAVSRMELPKILSFLWKLKRLRVKILETVKEK